MTGYSQPLELLNCISAQNHVRLSGLLRTDKLVWTRLIVLIALLLLLLLLLNHDAPALWTPCDPIHYVLDLPVLLGRWILLLRLLLSASLLVLTLQVRCSSSLISRHVMVVAVVEYHELLISSYALPVVNVSPGIASAWENLSHAALSSCLTPQVPIILVIVTSSAAAVNRSDWISALKSDWCCSSVVLILAPADSLLKNSWIGISLLRGYYSTWGVGQSCDAIIRVLPLIVISTWWSLANASFFLYNDLLMAAARSASSRLI